jgi:hypothetical protein
VDQQLESNRQEHDNMKKILIYIILISNNCLLSSQTDSLDSNIFSKTPPKNTFGNDSLRGVIFDCSNKNYIEDLLQRGIISIESEFDNKETPLHLAFVCNDTLFLKNNNVELSKVKNKKELMAIAMAKHNYDVVEFACKQNNGFPINEPDLYSETVLYETFYTTSDTNAISFLIRLGACLDCGKYTSYYVLKKGMELDYHIPLTGAVCNHDSLVFNYAIDIYRRNNLEYLFKKRDLIETAIMIVNFDRTAFFLNYFDKACINDYDSLGETLLNRAAESIGIGYFMLSLSKREAERPTFLENGERILRLLIKNGADSSIRNKNGDSIQSLLKDVPIDINKLVRK